jgi:LPXTG-site transpeptidase (sortase) family protein
MSLKVYVKDESFDPIYKEVSKEFYARSRVVPSLLIFTGIAVFLTQVALPLVVFKTQNETGKLLGDATIIGRTAGFSSFEFKELKVAAVAGASNERTDNPFIKTDYDPRKNVENQISDNDPNIPRSFYLSIPKLNIEDAVVETNASHLNPDNALGHYPNTALPGQNGNTFIFGHSVLPWFFNPKNYKTIFSTLDNLKQGDKIYLKYNNNVFTYEVTTKEELKPNLVNPLEEKNPKFMNSSTLTLMTCWPAGTKMKRLLVSAELMKY